MLVSPGCICSLGVLGERVVAHEHEPDIQLGVHLLDRQHLPPIRWLKEAFGLNDDAVGKEEVWGVGGLCDVLKLLHLVEVGDVQLVQSFGDTLF